MSGTLKINTSSEIMCNDISMTLHLPDAPVLDFCNVYMLKNVAVGTKFLRMVCEITLTFCGTLF